MRLRITRRHKYLIHAFLISIMIYFFSISFQERTPLFIYLIIGLTIAGGLITHSPNLSFTNIIVTNIVPLHLVVGLVLTFIFFPNLSLIFKVLAIIAFGIIFYIISLVNNVFLVVDSRSEPIPLYRVANTWSKIVLIVVAIPFFAGVFKLSINSFYQAGIVTISALLFVIYLLWSLYHNADVKKYKVGEILGILGFSMFLIFSANISVSFFPTESFLRALFIASVLMFVISYTEAHFKNLINRKLISEHILISFLFLLLLLIFNP